MTRGPVGLRTQVALPQNPSHSQSFRDFSSTRTIAKEYSDIFETKEIVATPWISENTLQLSHPKEYTARIETCNLVQTGGNTNMAHVTHHSFARPKMPPGTVDLGLSTTWQYVPLEDPATSELQSVAHAYAPHLESVLAACAKYHLHCPKDGWISTTGFITCSAKAGVKLSRAEFLALERAVPKDTLGRINYFHVAKVVQHIVKECGYGEEEGAAAADAQ